MQRLAIAGLAVTLAGAAGYVAGVLVAYPGRAFSVTAVMVGITVLALGAGNGRAGETEGPST